MLFIWQGKEEHLKNLLKSLKNGAVGEAYGCYFDKNSKVVSENTTIGIKINDAKKLIHILL